MDPSLCAMNSPKFIALKHKVRSCADPEGGEGGGGGRQVVRSSPLKNHKKYRVSKQYWSGSPDKITKLPSHRFAGGPMMARFE